MNIGDTFIKEQIASAQLDENTFELEVYMALSLATTEYLHYFLAKEYEAIDKTSSEYRKYFLQSMENENIKKIEENISSNYAAYFRQAYIWVMFEGGINDSNGKIEAMFKKGFKEIYNGFMNQKNIEVFTKNLLKKYVNMDLNEPTKQLTIDATMGAQFKIKKAAIEILNEYILLVFLSRKHNKELPQILQLGLVSNFFDFHLAIFKNNDEHRRLLEREKSKVSKEEIKYWMNYFLLDELKASESIYFEDILEYLKSKERRVRNDFFTDDIRLVASTPSLEKYVSMLTRFIHMGRGKSVIDSIKFTKKELEEIIKLSIAVEKCLVDKKNKELKEMNMFATFFFAVMIKEYNTSRQKFVELMGNDEILKVMESAERKSLENESIKEELQRTKLMLANESEKVKFAEKSQIELEKENTLLKAELQKAKSNEKELIALREMLYQKQSDDVELESDEMQLILNKVKNKPIVIVGGHPNWQKKIKAILPNAKMVDIDKKGVSLSFLSNNEWVVIFNTATNSHSFYEKFMNEMRKNDNPLHYINENGSTDRFIEWLGEKII